EQVRPRSRLAHADAEAALAARDARQDRRLDRLAGVLEQDRPALPVGGEVQRDRRVGDAELLGDDVALEEAPLAAAVALGPGPADPAPRADLAAEFGAVLGAAARRRVRAGHLPAQELADLGAQRL